MSTETIEEWAASRAPTMNRGPGGWQLVERIAAEERELGFLWTREQARALLAYRAKVAASLTVEQAKALWTLGFIIDELQGPALVKDDGVLAGELLALGLARTTRKDEIGDHSITNFGREIARFMGRSPGKADHG